MYSRQLLSPLYRPSTTTTAYTMGGMHIIWVGVVVAAIAIVAWLVIPKGKNQVYVHSLNSSTSSPPSFSSLPISRWLYSQTYCINEASSNLTPCYAEITLINRLIRTCIALTLTCTYLMWAITYLAQLHPLIGESRLRTHASSPALWCFWLSGPCSSSRDGGKREEARRSRYECRS